MLSNQDMHCLIYFNPRSPCGERPLCTSGFEGDGKFQSTLSVWRATNRTSHSPCFQGYFNPRSPCGERLELLSTPAFGQSISIHALRVESDDMLVCDESTSFKFQSTLSVWRATKFYQALSPNLVFQSTLSVWRATSSSTSWHNVFLFQSTLSVWRATGYKCPGDRRQSISIHALRVESDPVVCLV